MKGYRLGARSPRMLAAVMLRDDLADYVAEGGSLAQFARDRAMSPRGVEKAWLTIRRGLGAQAV